MRAGISNGAGPLSDGFQNREELTPICHQVLIALLDRLEGCHGGLRKQGFELTPTHRCALRGRGFTSLAAQQRIKTKEIVCLRPLRVAELETAFWVSLGPFDLFSDQFRRVEQGDAASLVWVALAHLAATVGEAHHPSTILEDQRFGNLQDRGILAPEPGIDALLGDVTGELEMLFLVLSDGDEVRVIQKDVSSADWCVSAATLPATQQKLALGLAAQRAKK